MTEATIEETRRPPALTPEPRARGRGATIEARRLTLRRGAQRLLSEVSFAAQPGELVAVLGASGSGKSTLLGLLAGLRRASEGHVLLGGLPADADELADAVGFVPQDDVLHLDLTPREALTYASDLRRRPCFPRAERAARVRALLEQLGLRAASERRVRRLSGGQRKRVSLGLELLDDPGVLLLDEPTAGLDPSLHRRLLGLFRQLADEGRTVVLSTHRLEDLDRCDRLVVLDAGRLVFEGSPALARERFGIADLTLLYDRLPRRAQEEAAPGQGRGGLPAARPRRPATSPPRWRQAWTVLRRAGVLLLRDRRRSAILLAQAPLLALVVAAALEGPALLLFLLVLTAIWCGTSTAARELVKERPVFLREQRAGLSLLAYLAAKGALLAGVAGLQVALLLGVVAALRTLPGELLSLYGALMASALAASALGLAISAAARTPDQANALVPLALIPQVLLAGALTTPSELSEGLGRLTPARWGYDLALRLSVDDELPIRDEGEQRAEADGLAARERELSARAARVLEDQLAPEGRGHARGLRALRGLRRESRGVDQELDALDQELVTLRVEQERTDRLVNAAAERVDILKGRKEVEPPPVQPGQSAEQRRHEIQSHRWAERLRAGRRLVDDVDDLIAAARALERAGQPIDARVARLGARRERLQERERELREASREDEGEWRRAVERIAGARASARRLWEEAERLDQRRVALSDELAQGRIARFEAWGSPRRDLAALAGFALACAGVAALGLRRA